MSYKNKVFQKLFETKEVELSKEGVELNLAGDVKKVSSNYKELIKTLPKYLAEAKAIESSMERIKDFNQKAEAEFEGSLDVAQTFRTAAKELGIDPLENEDYKEMNSLKKQVSNAIKEIDKLTGKYN